ncbi:MAG: hypothetical protein DMG39_00165 [Acidobacteria bacterium]|nr:MAG: hypothetical protein DMG39_00165 [Acidobacteriota bacterium]
MMFLLVCSFITVAWCRSALAQERTGGTPAVNMLVRVLQAKGILTADEVAQLAQASSASDTDQRLAKLLLMKGVISQADYDLTVSTASVINASAPASSSPNVVAAVYRVPLNNVASVGPARTPPPQEPKVVPAVAPVRVLPIDVPKQGGLIPDIKLGSGASVKLYGFFKASADEDTTSSGGSTFGSNDFPLPLLLGDTGPTSDPQFHIKARSFRIGSQFEWAPKDSNLVLTGRIEADYEGDFTNANSVNISSIRNGEFRTRLAWARLDTKLGGSLPWFAEFGQDWTLYSSTLPALYESTGTAIGMGALWERAPMFRTGVQFHRGDLKIQPEFAIVLPVAGSASLTDEQRARFGDRAGAESNQPALESRVVLQFPLSHTWQAVAPAQLIVSGHHARMNEIIPASSLSATVIAGSTGCATPPCSVLTTFPHGVQVGNPQNIWTAEAQLPTPWVTWVTKYYSGDDMRFPFGGQLNDVFADLNGTTTLGAANAALSFSGRSIPFGCAGGTGTPLNCNGSPISIASLRPIRGQGGFSELSFPLSRIFHADPDSRKGNGLARTDLDTASLTYKVNAWMSIIHEVSYIDTRAANHGGKIFRGIPATQAHSWRNEFGTVFTF